MSLTTAQAFAKFLEDITATDYQEKTFIPARKRTVDEHLSAKFPSGSDLPYWKGILMGSAAKNTIIRPFDDVDVLAVFSNEKKAWDKYRHDSKSFIYRIRDAYSGLSVQQVGTRGQAIRVFYQNGGHVDVAPVFLEGDGVYWLPAGDGTWIRTAPTRANDWYLERHRNLGYQLSSVVRLAKSWNRAHSKHFRSFHLETVAATVFSGLGSNCRDAMEKFFEWAPTHLDVQDPGGQSGNLSSYLTWNGRQQALAALKSAKDRAESALKAEANDDHTEAKRLWRIILGDDFPTS